MTMTDEERKLFDVSYIIDAHRYDAKTKFHPDDPGLHKCSCGEWVGYYFQHSTHVARKILKYE